MIRPVCVMDTMCILQTFYNKREIWCPTSLAQRPRPLLEVWPAPAQSGSLCFLLHCAPLQRAVLWNSATLRYKTKGKLSKILLQVPYYILFVRYCFAIFFPALVVVVNNRLIFSEIWVTHGGSSHRRRLCQGFNASSGLCVPIVSQN